MIDISKETLIHLSEVPGLLPRHRGKLVHLNTVRLWTKRGVRGVKLGICPVGKKVFTSKEELARFTERQATPDAVRTPSEARRDLKRAKDALESAGF